MPRICICDVFVLVLLIACNAESGRIRVPTVAEVETRLNSNVPEQIRTGLRDIVMFELPMQAQAKKFLHTDYEVSAWTAYLGSGGDPQELADYLNSLPNRFGVFEDGRVIEKELLAEVLIHFGQHEDLAVQKLFATWGNVTNDCDWMFRYQGKAQEQVLLNFVKLLEGIDRHDSDFTPKDYFPMTLKLQKSDWPKIRGLFNHDDERVRFLIAYYLLTGPFDDVNSFDVVRGEFEPDPIVRTAQAAHLLRQNPGNQDASKTIREALSSLSSCPRRIAIIGADALENHGEAFHELILQSLFHPDPDVIETALTAIERWDRKWTGEMVAYVASNCDSIPQHVNTYLREILGTLHRHGSEQDVVDALSELFLQPEFDMRVIAAMFAADHLYEQFTPEILDVLAEPIRSPKEALLSRRDSIMESLQQFTFEEKDFAQISDVLTGMLAEDYRDMRSNDKLNAARLLWLSGVDRRTPIEWMESWLKSDDSREVDKGIDLAEAIAQDVPGVFSQLLEVAMRNPSALSRMSHGYRNSRQSRDFLASQLSSDDPLRRATAAHLLVSAIDPEIDELIKASELLDDETPTSFQFFGEYKRPINVTIAKSLARNAVSDRRVWDQLRQSEVVLQKLETILGHENFAELKDPPPTPVELALRPDSVDFDVMLAAMSDWDFDYDDGHVRIPNELFERPRGVERIISLLELIERNIVLFVDITGDVETAVPNAAWGFAELGIANSSIIDVLERCVSKTQLLTLQDRHDAAEALLGIDPENGTAKDYIDRCRRAFGVDFYSFIVQ